MPTSTAGKQARSKRGRQRGFTYAMALVAIVVIGIFAGVANLATSRMVQADREEELMFRGQAYRSAIQYFYTVAGRYPRTVDELLKDPRFAQHAYLRTAYSDPMANEQERKDNGGWRFVRAADGGITGVASRSRVEPLKKANFPLGFEAFEQAKSYSEWLFAYSPRQANAPGMAPGPLVGGAPATAGRY